MSMFIFNPRNHAFIQGQQRRPDIDWELIVLAFLLFAIWVLGIIPAGLFHALPLLPALIFTMLCYAVALLVMLRFLSLRRFIRSGRVLSGQVIACHEEFDGKIHHVRLCYRYISPHTQQPITGTSYQMYPVHWQGELPQPGAEVVILYQNDRRHRLL